MGGDVIGITDNSDIAAHVTDEVDGVAVTNG